MDEQAGWEPQGASAIRESVTRTQHECAPDAVQDLDDVEALARAYRLWGQSAGVLKLVSEPHAGSRKVGVWRGDRAEFQMRGSGKTYVEAFENAENSHYAADALRLVREQLSAAGRNEPFADDGARLLVQEREAMRAEVLRIERERDEMAERVNRPAKAFQALRRIAETADTLSPQEVINVVADGMGIPRWKYNGGGLADRSQAEMLRATRSLAALIGERIRRHSYTIVPKMAPIQFVGRKEPPKALRQCVDCGGPLADGDRCAIHEQGCWVDAAERLLVVLAERRILEPLGEVSTE